MMAMTVAPRVSRGIAGTEKEKVGASRQTIPLGLSRFAPIAPVVRTITLKGSNIAQGSPGRIPSTALAGDQRADDRLSVEGECAAGGERCGQMSKLETFPHSR